MLLERHNKPALFYRVHLSDGQNLPVIMLQGLGLSSSFWFDLPARISSAQNVTVVTPDNRGTGRSEAGQRPVSMKALAQDVIDVANAAGFPRFILLGVSMGSMIAQHVALNHSERVAALMLVSSSPGVPHFKFPKKRLWPALIRGPLKNAPPQIDVLSRVLLSPADRPRAAKIFARWNDVFDERAQGIAVKHQIAAVLSHATGKRLRGIKCPTTIVHGQDDALIHVNNAHFLAKTIAHARLQIVQHTGHSLVHTRSDIIESALSELRSLAANH